MKVVQSRSMFSFMNDRDQDRDALVALSRETLRELGKHDDQVTLHLPFSLSPSDSKGTVVIHSMRLPSGLETLQKTAVLEIHNLSARNALSGKMMAQLADIVMLLEDPKVHGKLNAVVLRGTKTAVLEIHNLSARNALSGKMMAQLADIVMLLEDPKVHGKLNAVVLRGTEGWFCAGADLRVARQQLNSREAGAAMSALMVDTLTRFRRLPLVSVAAIEGGAFGGGAELATACDFRIIESNAVIQFVQSRMGVVPGWGGEKISPERAIEMRLVDEIFNATSGKAAITSFVEPFDVIAPAVSHGAKRVINNADDVSLDDVLEYEHSVFKTLWG
ncbi:Hypothetical protein PHPALM_13452, partial [Phytophthora palmivora]